jgi:hypothetical protein
MPRQDPADSGVDLMTTHDLDLKEQLMSQALHDEGEPLLPIYSASQQREPANTRNREKARQKLIEAFRNLTEKRENVLGLRLRVQEARNSLRHDRETSSNRDAQLVQRLRAAIASNSLAEQTPLVDELEDLQKSRDSLSPKEDNYNRLEDQLNREEWELKEMELRLYQRDGSAQISLLGDDDDVGLFEGAFGETDSSSSLSIHSGPVEDSPETKRYLSRRGDAILLREQIADMRAAKAQIIEDEAVRKRIGHALDEESQSFLDNFDSRLKPLLEDLANVEEDISRLQGALTEKRVAFLSSPFDGEDWDAPTHYAPEAILSDFPSGPAAESASTEFEVLTRDPLLLPVDDREHALFDSSDPATSNAISTPGYINRWLLHSLRRSIPEVRRYKSAEELKQLRLRFDQEQIKDFVLDWWYKDQSVADFRTARNTAALSLDLPLSPIPTHIYRVGARSEPAAPIVHDLLARAPPEVSPTTLIPKAVPVL